MAIAIVPMKGNNQRLPGKNTVSLGDRPMCYWLLSTLLKCDSIDRIIVDVWGEELIDAVSAMPGADGLEISPRPIEYCDPMAGGNRLLERFVECHGDTYVQCHVTSPFLRAETLDRALKLISDGQAESCFGATQLQQRLWLSPKEYPLQAINHDPSGPIMRTQDLPPVYMENGSFFAFTGEKFLRDGGTRNGPDSVPVPLEYPETVDVDEHNDLALARAVVASGSHL